MHYILTTGWEDGVADLTQRLAQELTGGNRVLWLVSGGSNIPATVQTMESISPALSQNLTIMPVDERFGPYGHADSNWQQLIDAGFTPQNATVLEVLQPGLDLEQTISRYSQLAEKAFSENNVIIAQLGIGEDGHIAGIMLNAGVAESKKLVVKIAAEPHLRLTISFAGFRLMTAVYAFAFGSPKHTTLTQLRDASIPLDKQPAQILKELPEVYIYNDQVGEAA